MKELPDDLAAMRDAQLSGQRAIRDDKLATLFQRWPAPNGFELRQLRQMYAERLRIARYVGRLRAATLRPSKPSRAAVRRPPQSQTAVERPNASSPQR